MIRSGPIGSMLVVIMIGVVAIPYLLEGNYPKAALWGIGGAGLWIILEILFYRFAKLDCLLCDAIMGLPFILPIIIHNLIRKDKATGYEFFPFKWTYYSIRRKD